VIQHMMQAAVEQEDILATVEQAQTYRPLELV
jgi:hypothetical protein